MQVGQLYTILEDLKNGKTTEIDSEALRFLKANQFVNTIDVGTYQESLSSVSKLEEISKDYAQKYEKVHEYRRAKYDLTKKINSAWHQFWTNDTKLYLEKKQLVETKVKLLNANKDFFKSKKEKERLEKINNSIKNYLTLSEECVAPTEKVDELLPLLNSRLERLSNQTYDVLIAEHAIVKNAIDARYNRFKQFHDSLIKKGYNDEWRTTRHALFLSTFEGEFEELYDTTTNIDNLMVKAFKKHSYSKNDAKRLPIIITLMDVPGSISENVDKLRKLYEVSLNDNINCYETLFEQARCIKMPDTTLAKIYRRYINMQNALDNNYWSKGNPGTCYVASQLINATGYPSIIAKNFRELEESLIDIGIIDSVESGIAALMIMGREGTITEKVEKFQNALDATKKYGMYNSKSTCVRTALISVMPGRPEETILWMNYISELMEKDKFKDRSINKELFILDDAFGQLAKTNNQSIFKNNCPSYLQDYKQLGIEFNMRGNAKEL